MRILLLSPNTLTEPYPVYPIGLDYVAGSIPAGHEVRRVDLNVTPLPELDHLVTLFNPDLIGVSCRNLDNTEMANPRSFLNEYTNLVRRLRSNTHSNTTIIVGGCGFNIMPHQLLAAIGADYGLVGEGERFGLLVEALAQQKNPLTIPGTISSTPPDEQTIPSPWQGDQKRRFDKSAYYTKFYLERGGMLNLQSKRGCRFNCIYCSYPAIEGKKQRLFPPETVARTALELEQAGARYLFITDSAFNSDIAHSLEVARAFRKAGVSIPWGAFFAPIKLPKNYFSILAESGLTHVEFGTESLSNPVLKSYRKPFTIQDVFLAHERARAASLHVAHYLLLGGPGETEKTIHESLDNTEKLKKTVIFFFIGMRIYPQTHLYDIAFREGLISEDTNLLTPVFYQRSDIPDYTSIEKMVTTRAGSRINWLVGSGEDKSADIIARMHQRGYAGPLWEHLTR
ncbi:MAG: B12-binding domain-containing radical SAM protein [Desulfobulbus propionicus]|nr:MAG: B12-binding domain-containing radical SAM protein [Desulfobulbus propionicus]